MGRERNRRLARRKVVTLVREGLIITPEDAVRAYHDLCEGKEPRLSDKTDPETLQKAFPRYNPADWGWYEGDD